MRSIIPGAVLIFLFIIFKKESVEFECAYHISVKILYSNHEARIISVACK